MNHATPTKTLLTLDTCVLMHRFTRHVLLHLYTKEICDIAWSNDIGKEWLRNAPRIWKVDISLVQHEWLSMQILCPHANIGEIPRVQDAFEKTDPKDRHVALCALLAQQHFNRQRSTLLTWNIKDFHKKQLLEHGILLQTPDHYLSELWLHTPHLLLAVLEQERRRYIELGMPSHPLLEILKRDKLFRLAKLYTVTLPNT